MRMKSLILIFIALGCGLVASIGISQVMDRGGSGGSLEVEQILVALSDIDIGSKLDANNVKLEDWPKQKVPEGAIRRLDDVKEKFANSRFFKGEPIHISKVTDQLGNIATKVPQGYRAMPVKVDEDTVMKAISPGDRVDVMVFLRKNLPDIPETGAFTILRNVRVFAINSNTERATDGKEASNFRTVSLLVKPEHSRELVIAGQLGKIMLTLRRPDESDADDIEDVTPLKDILGGRAQTASDPPAGSSTNSQGQPFLGFVKNTGALTVPPTIQPVSTPVAEPQWTMLILGPAETQQFEWMDKKNLPVKSTTGNGADPSPTTSGSSGGVSTNPTSSPSPAPGPEALSDPEQRPNRPPQQPKNPEDGK
jgi:pilus assembly protein CpaB